MHSSVSDKYRAIIDEWAKWKPVIDDAVEAVLDDLPEAVAVDAAKYIASGGKRFRGFLVVLVAGLYGGEPSRAVPGAVAVELVHASSLALDDIIDGDTVRRGREAAWIRYGVSKTVMVSNLLVPYAQRIVMEAYGPAALEKTVHAWLDVSRGEVLDAFTDPGALDPGAYYDIAVKKTGALFRLSCELGAIASGNAGRDEVEKIGVYGEMLGLVYQYADDTVDLAHIEKGLLDSSQLPPSTKLFLEINKTTSSALDKLREIIERVDNAVRGLRMPLDKKEVLTALPRFMAEAMLKEGGVSGLVA